MCPLWTRHPSPKRAILHVSKNLHKEYSRIFSNANGSPVVMGDCAGGDNQLWTFTNGAVTAYGGTKCLDVTGGVDSNGVKLQIWDCWPDSLNQQWYWTGDNHLAWTNHGRCMDLTDGNLANGNTIQIWDCDGYVEAYIGCLITHSHISGAMVIKARIRLSLFGCRRLILGAFLVWNVGYLSNNLPHQSQNGQTGYNDCGTDSSSDSMCQTLCTLPPKLLPSS